MVTIRRNQRKLLLETIAVEPMDTVQVMWRGEETKIGSCGGCE